MDTTGTIAAAVIAHSSFEYLGKQGDGHTVIACNCHNPDGNGEGARTFSGPAFAEALDAWYEHVLDVVDAALTAEAVAAENALLEP
jgi:hypothetical protein